MSSKLPKKTYREKLDKQASARYTEKLELIAGIDPFEVDMCDLSVDLKCLPAITYIDILNYCVHKQSAYTMSQLKAYKTLDAYNQFVCGWVKDVHLKEFGCNILVIGRCRHSQSMNKTLRKPWVVAEIDGTVLTAHCDCMAGLGEVCSHVGALLFYIDAAVRIESCKTVTEEKAYWKLPSSIDKVKYDEINNINFSSAKTMKRKLDCHIDSDIVTKRSSFKLPSVEEPTITEVNQFNDMLFRTNTRPVALSILPDYSDNFIPMPTSENLPRPLLDLEDEEAFDMPLDELQLHCATLFDEIKVDNNQKEEIEKSTRGQANNNMWHNYRVGRVTASRMKSVCSTSSTNPAISTINAVCRPIKFSNKATKWGCDHEKDALKAYEKIMNKSHENFRTIDSGLILSEEYPFIGASPDALVTCWCCGEGTVEVKCPFCVRNSVINSEIPFLTEQKLLKTTHQYYYQAQTQIFVSGREFCDFVVWTEKDILIDRILPDTEFWETAVAKARVFFKSVVLPELVGRYFSSGRHQSTRNETVTNQTTPATNQTTQDIVDTESPANTSDNESTKNETVTNQTTPATNQTTKDIVDTESPANTSDNQSTRNESVTNLPTQDIIDTESPTNTSDNQSTKNKMVTNLTTKDLLNNKSSVKTSKSNRTQKIAPDDNKVQQLELLNMSTEQNNEPLICLCQVPYDEEYDDVIGCDSENCPFVWFHFKCVGLKSVPKGKYYCANCKPEFRKGKNAKKLKA